MKSLLILPVAPQPINVPTPPTRPQNLPSTMHLLASSFKNAIHQKTSREIFEVCRQLAHAIASLMPQGADSLFIPHRQPCPVLFLTEEMHASSNHTTRDTRCHLCLPAPSPIFPRKTVVKAGLVHTLSDHPPHFLCTNMYAVLCTQTEVCFENRNGALTSSHGRLPPSAHYDEGDPRPEALQKSPLPVLGVGHAAP